MNLVDERREISRTERTCSRRLLLLTESATGAEYTSRGTCAGVGVVGTEPSKATSIGLTKHDSGSGGIAR